MKKLILVGLSLSLGACVTSGKHNKLQSEHDKTTAELAAMKTAHNDATTKIEELETLIVDLERKLGKSSDDKKSLSSAVEHMKEALKEASIRKKESEKRIAEYQNLVKNFQKLTDAGQLSIKIVDGRMVVALPSDVLFRSGSSRLSNKGQSTIKEVAKLLVGIENKKFQVEGHTDNVPIRTAAFPSNWELASARAVNVLRTMVDAGMPSERISAASYGETRPFMENADKAGRAANRRIEVVVVPDLSTLPGYEELSKFSSDEKTTQ